MSADVTSDELRDDGGSLLTGLTSGVRTWYGTVNLDSTRQTPAAYRAKQRATCQPKAYPVTPP